MLEISALRGRCVQSPVCFPSILLTTLRQAVAEAQACSDALSSLLPLLLRVPRTRQQAPGAVRYPPSPAQVQASAGAHDGPGCALHSLRKCQPRIRGARGETRVAAPASPAPQASRRLPAASEPSSPVPPSPTSNLGRGGGGGVQCKVKIWVLLFKNDQECSAGDDLLLGLGVFPGQS